MRIENRTERARRRGSRGTNRGRGLHCSACGDPAAADPCSEQCRTELEPHDGYEMREAK